MASAAAVALVSACAHGSKHEHPYEDQICPHVLIFGETDPGFSDTEKRLICGDTKTDDAVGKAWREIPLNQATFNLKTFLQDRGFFQPKLQKTPEGYSFDLGPRTRVTQVHLEGAPPDLKFERRRHLVGEVLTPGFLGVQEQWLIARMQGEGYGCPAVTSEGDPKTGEVVFHIRPGQHQNLVGIVEEPIPGLNSGMLRRYDAFELGQPFNGDMTTLTSRRIIGQGVVQSAHFVTSCGPNGVTLKQEAIPGLPRILRFGLGVDTEGLVRGKASWKNTRWGDTGSQTEITAIADRQRQRLAASLTWFNFPFPSRRYLRPLVQITHEDVDAYRTLTAEAQFAHGTSWDFSGWGIGWRIGPSFEQIHTFRGGGQGDLHFLSLESELRFQSHYFEYYSNSPRAGFNASLLTNFSHSKLGSDATVQRVYLTGEGLWNYHSYDPPWLVFGVRGAIGATLTGEGFGPDSALPATYRQYLGGSGDLRGFGRLSLKGRTGNGGLTSAFSDFEMRFADMLPFNMQPFVFIDLGALGTNSASLEKPIYWAPGLGIRWESPIGVVRTTLARGFVTGDPAKTQWQLFFGLGEEF